MHDFLGRLRRAVGAPEGAPATDAELLARYATDRDAAAFAELVARHGQMVFGVCRRALAVPDAEDAFQATFLVLMRRAASVVPREQLAAWLHGVARRTALKARERAQRRFARERPVAELPDVGAVEKPREEALAVIDEELERLPSKYRVPVVLCDVEGLTREEAARRLGWVVGTLSWRLSAARKLLADRLSRRGVGLSVAALASAAGAPPAVAGVPSPEVVSLAEGVLSAMTTTKLRLFAGALCVALLAGLGTVAVAIPVAPAPVPNFAPPAFGRAEPKLLAELEHDSYVHTVAFRSDGQFLATSGGHKARPIFGLEKVVPVSLWNPRGRLLGTIDLTDFHALDLLRFAPNGHLLVGGADPRLLDPLSGKVTARFQLKVPEKFRRAVDVSSFSADGKVLATVMGDGSVCVWDAATGEQKARVPCDTRSVALAPDGKSLVFTTGRDAITVWDVNAGKARVTFSSPGDAPDHLLVSPNGKLIAHSAFDTSNPRTGATLLFLTDVDGIVARRLRFELGEHRVAAVLFSSDGELLVTMSYDWGVRVWDVRTGDQLAALRDAKVLSVALSPDGKTLAVGAAEIVKLWDISALRKKK